MIEMYSRSKEQVTDWNEARSVHMDINTGFVWVPKQSTWMDTVNTQRQGYPVEIQALWYNALIKMRDIDKDKARDYDGIAKKVKVDYSGPIQLPTKYLEIPAKKSPDGEGSATWDHWEMRIHKRMIDIDADERALHQVMKVSIPQDVNIEIQVIE